MTYEPYDDTDLSHLSAQIAARCTELGVDLESCEPGSARVVWEPGGWIHVFVGWHPVHDLGQFSVLLLQRGTTPGTLN